MKRSPVVLGLVIAIVYFAGARRTFARCAALKRHLVEFARQDRSATDAGGRQPVHGADHRGPDCAAAKQIDLSTHVEQPDLVVRGDTERLQQVLWNLLSNAVKFTPAGGAVDVYLTRHESLAEIRIEDTGPGVPDAFLPRIFDRFSQADGSSTRTHSGLG